MKSLWKTTAATMSLSVVLVALHAGAALGSEAIRLDDGTTCTVIDGTGTALNGSSTTVTAGNGQVSSSTTLGGSNPDVSVTGSTSSAAASSSTTGNAGGEAFSMSSVKRPDGTVVTRRSDGTCSVTRP